MSRDDLVQIDVGIPPWLHPVDWDDFLNTTAMALDAYAVERFETGGDGTWPATQWPRIAELLNDLRDGVVRKRTLQREHQTGVATGALRRSIHASAEANDSEFPTETSIVLSLGGPDVDYAERFHEGGHGSIEVPQREFRRWYHTSEGKEFIRAHQIGWLFSKASYDFEQPPRPIVTAEGIKAVVESEARERWPEWQ